MSGLPINAGFGATASRAGAMSAELYRQLTGTAQTDPTAAINIAGSSGSYATAAFTSVQSSIDAWVTSIAYDYLYDTGNIGAGTLLPVLCFHGFGQNRAQFDATWKQRIARYRDPDSGRAPLLLAVTEGTTMDWCRRVYDWRDVLADAVSQIGASNIYGGGTVCVCLGVSAGSGMAAQFTCHFPDLVGALIMLYPLPDLGKNDVDGYWARKDASVRSTLTSQIGDRVLGAVDKVDPYFARDVKYALPSILALPGAPQVWVAGSRNDVQTNGLNDPDLLVGELQGGGPVAASRVHNHVTPNSEDTEILHDEGLSVGGTLAFEKRCWRTILRDIRPWTLPKSGTLPVIGYMEAREVTGSANPADDRAGMKFWTGPNTSPRTDSAAAGSPAGGRLHAGVLTWRNEQRFEFDPATSGGGYIQAKRNRGYDISETLTAGARATIDLSMLRTVSSLAAFGAVHEYRSDQVVGSAPVTQATDQIGSAHLADASHGPAQVSDGTRTVLRFAAASSNRLVYSGLLWDPRLPFAVVLVYNKTSASTQVPVGEGRGGTLEESRLVFNTNRTDGHYLKADNGDGAGVVGGAGVANAMRVAVYMRSADGYLYGSVDGSALLRGAITTEWTGTTAVSGTNGTVLGGGNAASGGSVTPYLFPDMDFVHMGVWDRELSAADILSLISYFKTMWSF